MTFFEREILEAEMSKRCETWFNRSSNDSSKLLLIIQF